MRDASSHQKNKEGRKEKEKKSPKNTLQTLAFILLEIETLKAGFSIREK